jgi:hypothetical protein
MKETYVKDRDDMMPKRMSGDEWNLGNPHNPEASISQGA